MVRTETYETSTTSTFDAADRVVSVVRMDTDVQQEVYSAAYTYYANLDLVQRVDYRNETAIEYQYDNGTMGTMGDSHLWDNGTMGDSHLF